MNRNKATLCLHKIRRVGHKTYSLFAENKRATIPSDGLLNKIVKSLFPSNSNIRVLRESDVDFRSKLIALKLNSIIKGTVRCKGAEHRPKPSPVYLYVCLPSTKT